MLLAPRYGEPLEQLASRIGLAAEPNRGLMDGVAAECRRFNLLRQAGSARHFDAWCESGAWLEAAFALVESELPYWSVRRLVKDSGFWFCSLSRSPNIPFEFDDMVEASHENMALAVILAFVEAKRTGAVTAPVARTTTDNTAEGCHRICCDNFA